ncbi:hypothetical protein D9M73_257180 [compost metagenome]
MGVEAADHVAAAVEVEHHRLQAVGRLAVAIQACGKAVAVAGGDGEVVAGDVVQRRIEKARGGFEVDPCLLRGLFVHGATFAGQAAELGEFEESFKFWQ